MRYRPETPPGLAHSVDWSAYLLSKVATSASTACDRYPNHHASASRELPGWAQSERGVRSVIVGGRKPAHNRTHAQQTTAQRCRDFFKLVRLLAALTPQGMKRADEPYR